VPRRLSFVQRLLHKTSHRLIRSDKLPKGAVAPFLRNLGMLGFYPERIVDVGANRGRWTEKALTVFPESSYTLVEPQLEMKSELDALCAKHRNVRWVQAGLAAVDGELPFTLTGRTSSTFIMSAAEAQAGGFAQRMVPVMTLERLCREVAGGPPDLLKIDAEGFEFEILKAAGPLLGEIELVLLELPFFHFSARPGALLFRDALVEMARHGYEVYDFTAFQKRRYDGALGQSEVAFARRDGVLRRHKDWA
jgi:FkbM family methyltransferase